MSPNQITNRLVLPYSMKLPSHISDFTENGVCTTEERPKSTFCELILLLLIIYSFPEMDTLLWKQSDYLCNAWVLQLFYSNFTMKFRCTRKSCSFFSVTFHFLDACSVNNHNLGFRNSRYP